MPLDAICLSGLVHELKTALSGGKIDKIYQPGRDEVILALRTPSGNRRLLLSANPNHPRPQLTELSRENPDVPPMFCMLLRKHLTGGRILDIVQPPLERVVEFRLETLDELGDRVERSLVLEAQFSQPLSTLSSGEEIPLLLAEGTFDPEAALAVEEMALPEEVPAGYTAVSAWRYTATGGGDTVILHLRAQDADAVAVLTGKGWQTARAEWDGSYLVWEGDAEGQIVLLRRSFSPLPLLPAVLGVLLLGTGVILHLRRRRKRTATR